MGHKFFNLPSITVLTNTSSVTHRLLSEGNSETHLYQCWWTASVLLSLNLSYLLMFVSQKTLIFLLQVHPWKWRWWLDKYVPFTGKLRFTEYSETAPLGSKRSTATEWSLVKRTKWSFKYRFHGSPQPLLSPFFRSALLESQNSWAPISMVNLHVLIPQLAQS